MVRSDTQLDTPGIGNCFIEALSDQTRHDPIHSGMLFTHRDLRHDVVHYVPDMVRLGLLSADIFYRGNSESISVQEWQNDMIREGTYTDEIFMRAAVELLGRQIILYPVIPDPNQLERVTISPSYAVPAGTEPFHILYYEEANFVNPHYQSIRPRPQPQASSIPVQPSNVRPTPTSLFSRLSAISNETRIQNSHSQSKSRDSTSSMTENVQNAPLSDTVPDNSSLMPPPNFQSSLIKKDKKKGKKRKCDEKCNAEMIPENSNSTDISSSPSLIPNSQESINLSHTNILPKGSKRKQKRRKNL